MHWPIAIDTNYSNGDRPMGWSLFSIPMIVNFFGGKIPFMVRNILPYKHHSHPHPPAPNCHKLMEKQFKPSFYETAFYFRAYRPVFVTRFGKGLYGE
jgi:hypothetical protein